MAPPRPIVLTTDFGLADSYVGVMKGVILTINPAALIVDLTHLVRPQDLGASRVHPQDKPCFLSRPTPFTSPWSTPA